MSAPADRTPATDSPEAFETTSHAPFLIAAEAYARWRATLHGPLCVCAQCYCDRAAACVHEEPSMLEIDPDDPAYVAEYRRARQLVENVEARQRELRLRRMAHAIAVERLRGQ
jgi:hypothetical protein